MVKNPKLVIIGSGSGGLPVASLLKKCGANYDITIFTRDTDIAYSPCGIPFVLGGDIPSFDDLLMEKRAHYTEMGIEIRKGVEVTRIDTDSNRIFVGDEKVEYDFLVIATGTIQSTQSLEGGDLVEVFPAHVKTLEDARELDEHLEGARDAVILGSGSIDLEMAAACLKRGLNVTVVEEKACLLSDWLDAEMADVVRSHLKALGIKVITGKKAKRINEVGKAKAVDLEDETIEADIVLTGMNLKPDTRLAMQDGIEVSEHGIVIDEACRVKKGRHILENVFASGACSQTVDFVTGKTDFFYRASSSIKKAQVIADRLMGKESILEPQVNPVVTVLYGLHVGCVGINSQRAADNGIRIKAGKAVGVSNSRYYPGGKPIHMKLLFEENSGKLIGGQVVSWERGVKERIDALGMAIRCGLTSDQIIEIETSYSPPVAHLTDVMTEAARNIKSNNGT